ncbi:hypothetical protein C8Z91_31420 [Paenibacillus elgii]|uniref:PilZ domain-containing protein n=1 Tax=Paenibacillus elgii TaxID=189691 RepID=A0A2T6FT83_9BACL|nr:hypothetical protein [Paenibacillus elgii]PUA35121.1 hypothetical protein C8Z91_31420 [Paenibacillus elgii]
MKDMQLLHQGKVYQGQVSYEGSDLMEVSCTEPSSFTGGESVICFDFQKRVQMRVLQVSKSKLILVPADSEIFNIQARPDAVLDDMYRDENLAFPSFKLNTYGTLIDDFRTMAVRFCRISRLGFGFEINDFSVKMNHVYDTMIMCDEETIHPKVVVRYAHIQEKTIRYGAEIYSISAKDLNKLRFYIVAQQFMAQ